MRSEFIGTLEHRDTVRKGSKTLYEYIDAGWDITEPNNESPTSSNTEKMGTSEGTI